MSGCKAGHFVLLTLKALCFKICSLSAEVAELVDAHGSGPCGSNLLRVQVPSSACRKYEKPLSYTQGFLVFTARRCVPLNPRVLSRGTGECPSVRAILASTGRHAPLLLHYKFIIFS